MATLSRFSLSGVGVYKRVFPSESSVLVWPSKMQFENVNSVARFGKEVTNENSLNRVFNSSGLKAHLMQLLLDICSSWKNNAR